MIWGYFDESGKLADSEFICLCGFLSDEKWEDFCDAWGVLLKQYGIQRLHMASLFARKEGFCNANWTENERDSALREFVKVIRSNTLACFGIALDATYYRGMDRQMKEVFGQKQAQDFVFQRLLRLVSNQLLEWKIPFGVSLMFDYSEDFSLLCLKSLARLRGRHEDIKSVAAAITFADSYQFFPLQAADMLAYGTFRNLRYDPPDYFDYLAGKKQRGPGPRPHSEFYTADLLKQICRKIKSGEIDRL